jgi:stalled ribosome rescue protein Dom34
MGDKAGVWIDHREASIIALTSDGVHTTLIQSKIQKHPERSGDSPLKGSYEALQVRADDRRQRALTRELNIYYDGVIAALTNCENLIIFGPGEAKNELHKRMAKTKPRPSIVAVETEDKMTGRQIAAKVRAYFGLAAPRGR